MTCQFCNSPESIEGHGKFNCGSYRREHCGFRSYECQLGESVLNLTKELSESNEYARRLNLKITDLCKERDALKAWIEDLSFWEWNPSTEKMGKCEVILDPQEFVYVGNQKPEGLK